MNKKIITHLAIATVTLAISASAQAAGFTNTFNSGPLPTEWTGDAAWSAGPVGWVGGGALQATSVHGGWTLGGVGAACNTVGGGPNINFNDTQKTDIRSFITSGDGKVSFDFIVDGTSFTAGGIWYQINIAGNSDHAGASGWTQIDKIVDWWQNDGQADLRTYHFETNFAALGWTDANSGYFQIFIGGNSSGGQDATCQTPDNSIHYWIDNVAITGSSSVGTSAIAITAFSRSGGNMNISGTGSPEGAAWRCLSSTSATASMASWTQVGSGTITGGTFSLSVAAGEPSATYYRMVTP